MGAGAVVSRSAVWSGCVIGDGALVDRCMLADGARVEPRKPVFAAVRTDDRRAGGPAGQDRAFWEPLAAVLKPVSPDLL